MSYYTYSSTYLNTIICINRHKHIYIYILDYSPSILVFEIKRKGQKREKTPAVGVGLQSVWTGASQGIFIARQTLPDNCFGKQGRFDQGLGNNQKTAPHRSVEDKDCGGGGGKEGGIRSWGGGGVERLIPECQLRVVDLIKIRQKYMTAWSFTSFAKELVGILQLCKLFFTVTNT